MEIKLNDILKLNDLENIKIKFNVFNGEEDPLTLFKSNKEELLKWQFWNSSRRSYYEGQTAIGFVKIEHHRWLLFDISKVTKDLGIYNEVGYEYETLNEYKKYFGRLIIEFKDNKKQVIRYANSVLDDCKVLQLLENTFDNDLFPGYDKVELSWKDLKRVLKKSEWKSALQNQKGVYLITDRSTGKHYIGSATGDKMIHGRWSDYIRSGHGGNKQLKSLSFDYIKQNFQYTILEIFKSTTETNFIIERENWWKRILLSGKFGYN